MILATLHYFALPYILLPAAGAALAAVPIADWRMAAAVFAVSLAFLWAFPTHLPAMLKYLLPLVIGTGIGGFSLLLLLLIRPRSSRWARIAVATLASVGAGMWLVFSNPGIA